MRSSRSDPRFEKAASILRLRDYAFLSFLLFALLADCCHFQVTKLARSNVCYGVVSGPFCNLSQNATQITHTTAIES